MFGINARYYLLYYIDMSIINYKKNMILPLWKLEIRKKLTYNEVHKNRIQNQYWNFMKLYNEILRWR